jgi:hypothetical protein
LIRVFVFIAVSLHQFVTAGTLGRWLAAHHHEAHEENEEHEEDHLGLRVLRAAPLLDRCISGVSRLQWRGKKKKKILRGLRSLRVLRGLRC